MCLVKNAWALLPFVPGIVVFINKDIELRILLFSFALSEPLLFRIHQKFKTQARVTHLPVYEHTWHRTSHVPIR
jgi:hypothetical protein